MHIFSFQITKCSWRFTCVEGGGPRLHPHPQEVKKFSFQQGRGWNSRQASEEWWGSTKPVPGLVRTRALKHQKKKIILGKKSWLLQTPQTGKIYETKDHVLKSTFLQASCFKADIPEHSWMSISSALFQPLQMLKVSPVFLINIFNKCE